VDSIVDDVNVSRGNWWRFDTVTWGPKIDTQPSGAQIGPDCEGTLTIAASSNVPGQGGTITYQWYKVGTPDTAIAGATSTSYTTGVEGSYYCIVKNDASQVRSNTVAIVVYSWA